MLQLEAEEEIQQKEVHQSIEKQRWEALHVLALALLHEDYHSSIKQCLQAGQLLTGASFLGVYLPVPDESNTFNLSFSWGEVSEFPNAIPISEISHLRIPYVWQPGTRGTSILHQKALMNQMAYLATSPIDQAAPLTGILMIGDFISDPPADLVQMLQVITGVLESCRMLYNSIEQAEKKGLRLEEKLSVGELIKENIADGLIIVDSENKIIEINPTAGSILGYSSEEVLGKHINQILVGEISISELLDQHAGAALNIQNLGELRLHRRDGVPILINLRLIPLVSDTLTSSFVILMSDLSMYEEYRQHSEKLRQKALMGQVMGIFAHEVRNPINNIGMGLQVMASNFPSEESLQSEISRMKQDIERIDDLVKSMLSVARSPEYKLKPINVKVLIESLLARSGHRLVRYKIEKKVLSPEEIPMVKGDQRALEQVFTNIIGNAINSMKADGGTLTIRISPEDTPEMLTIDIMDTGLGIPPEIKDQIFNPFFTTNPEGTGLGLAITKRIVVAHNGTIEVVDSIPGGTIFRIQLPVG